MGHNNYIVTVLLLSYTRRSVILCCTVYQRISPLLRTLSDYSSLASLLKSILTNQASLKSKIESITLMQIDAPSKRTLYTIIIIIIIIIIIMCNILATHCDLVAHQQTTTRETAFTVHILNIVHYVTRFCAVLEFKDVC
jgi:hypothetical protein